MPVAQPAGAGQTDVTLGNDGGVTELNAPQPWTSWDAVDAALAKRHPCPVTFCTVKGPFHSAIDGQASLPLNKQFLISLS